MTRIDLKYRKWQLMMLIAMS